MKKIFTLLSSMLIISAVASCEKSNQADNSPELAPVTIRLTGSAVKTKAAGESYATEAERAIKSIQFLVYDEKGSLIGEQRKSNGGDLVLYLPVGYLKIHTLVNMPYYDLESVSSEEKLLKISSHLSDSYKIEAKGMQMYGFGTLDHSKDGSRLDIEVKRHAAKLQIGQVKNMMLVNGVTIKNIYLINVVGDCQIDGSALANNSKWYNKRQIQPYNEVKDYNILNVDRRINPRETWGSIDPYSCNFYMYPNVSADYKTRLIFDVTIDGDDYYYPFTLPTIKGNQLYRVNLLEILKRGVEVSSSDPGNRDGEYDGDIIRGGTKADCSESIFECLEW